MYILFSLFFVWSYVLEIIAHFLLHHKLQLLKINLKNPIQISLLTGSALTFLIAYVTCLQTTPIFFILISALWITIFTDFSQMLISRWVSLYLIPVGMIASWYGMTQISIEESIISSCITAGILLLINKIFYRIKGHDGIGQGDIELLACIGAWLGGLGAWLTITIGSTLGTILAIAYMLITQQRIKTIPFGPCIAFGAIIVMLYENQIITLLLK